MEPNTFFIKTFGCQMNIRDTEIMSQKLGESGYVESRHMEDASVIILNTCAIRAKAEQKVYSLLGSLRKYKKNHPDGRICVAGCVAQQEAERIIERMPHVDLVIGTQQIYDLPALLSRCKEQPIVTELSDSYGMPSYLPPSNMEETVARVSPAGHSRFVTIMQGCNNYCTYCVVPYTRGREVSRNIEDIIEEIHVLVDTGVSEIVLLGQNVNSYGQVNSVLPGGGTCSFAYLLKKVSEINGVRRLRFTTSNPKDLSDELIDCFASIPNLCSQFHLPVQSGSDRILKKMNRKYTISDYMGKVDKLVAARPGIALSTDIIVGFPGETENDFKCTLDLLENVRFHGSFSFKYSDRPGTRAEQLCPKVEEEEKGRRLQLFQQRQDQISLERNQEFIGDIKEILIEKVTREGMTGRTETNHIVHLPGDSYGSILPGNYIQTRIIFAGQHSLKGEIVRP